MQAGGWIGVNRKQIINSAQIWGEAEDMSYAITLLELYSYNLEYMLNSNDTSDNERQEKLAKIKYTYEQVLATQAEQVKLLI